MRRPRGRIWRPRGRIWRTSAWWLRSCSSTLPWNKPIPQPFDRVAVLSASLDTVVAHVINGKYVPVSEGM